MKSLNKVIKIIDLLKENKEMRLQEIADEIGLYKSTASRIVSELKKYNYVERNNETKKYRLGLEFLNIAKSISSNLDIIKAAEEAMRELSKITKETIHLGMLLDNEAIYIDKIESKHTVRMYSEIGKTFPLYCTGIGKAIFAFQTREEINRLLSSIKLNKFTNNTITDKEQLVAELDKIKKDCFVIDNEEHESNICCIAAPIWNNSNKVVSAISIASPAFRNNINDLLEYKDIILMKSQEISRRLGAKIIK